MVYLLSSNAGYPGNHRVNFSPAPSSALIMHLKFLTGNFITGSSVLCCNGSVDKSLCREDNSPFTGCLSVCVSVCVHTSLNHFGIPTWVHPWYYWKPWQTPVSALHLPSAKVVFNDVLCR